MGSIIRKSVEEWAVSTRSRSALWTTIVLSILFGLTPTGSNAHSVLQGAVAGEVALFPGSGQFEQGQDLDSGRVNGFVRVICDYDDELIVAGEFTEAGGTVVNRIASWNGSTWSELGGGVNDVIWALAVYDGDLIAGGWFTEAGEVAASHIARWDGVSWAPLGSGVNGAVRALAVWQGKLIVGGDFTQAGGGAASKIAEWDGSSWYPMGSGFTGGYDDYGVRALALCDDKLFAGGFFTYSGSAPINRIAVWNESAWEPVGSWMDDTVYSLIHFDGALVAGTVVWSEGTGTWGNIVVRWDGTTWQSLGDGELLPPFPNAVRAFGVYDGKLYAGGQFIEADGTDVGFVACWNGKYWGSFSHWGSVGFGMNNNVFALAAFDGKLFAGGAFTVAGVEPANYVAFWDGDAWHALDSTAQTAMAIAEAENAPAGPAILSDCGQVISYSIPREVRLDAVIYDISGRRIRRLHSGTMPAGYHSLVWKGTDDTGASVAKGVYL